jgi:hypothetical protein
VLGCLLAHDFSEDLEVLSDFEKMFLILWPKPVKTLRPKTPTPATTPIKDWNTTLPALGSKYAKKLPICKIYSSLLTKVG